VWEGQCEGKNGKDDNKINNVSMSTLTLIHGDCIEHMKTIPSASVHMILVDLPYGMTKNKWDVVIPFETMWNEFHRIIKPNGAIVLFANNPFGAMLIASNLKNFRYSLIWEKNKFSDFLNAKRKPMKIHEDIHVFYKKQPVYNPQTTVGEPYERWNTQEAVDKQTNYGAHGKNHNKNQGTRLPTTVLKFPRVERPEHPTQKPVSLLEWLIKTYTNEQDVILDCCMGSGSTGVACRNTKRSFIGIELDDKYFEISTQNCKPSQ
jgi:site-specific DNA-methyltransferase (adenine-specific)